MLLLTFVHLMLLMLDNVLLLLLLLLLLLVVMVMMNTSRKPTKFYLKNQVKFKVYIN